MRTHFARNEEMRTEISTKFTRERLEASYADAGLELVEWWTDPDELYALSLARPAGLDARPCHSPGPCPVSPLEDEERSIVMKVFVAGATGALGKQLVPRLVAAGHEVVGHDPQRGARPSWCASSAPSRRSPTRSTPTRSAPR